MTMNNSQFSPLMFYLIIALPMESMFRGGIYGRKGTKCHRWQAQVSSKWKQHDVSKEYYSWVTCCGILSYNMHLFYFMPSPQI
jgi:hypothetical protein